MAAMGAAVPIATYIDDFTRLGREAFLRVHPEPLLLLASDKAVSDGSWSNFTTDSIQADAASAANLLSDEELAAIARMEALEVLTIDKSMDSPWRGRICLGRARNNDLVVKAPSISKLHAHFLVDSDGSLSVSDAGSQNGTLVNGTAVARGQTVPLRPRDDLQFGTVRAVFHTAESFYSFLATSVSGR